jgi:GDPmannose 4,6-dehydratase
MKKTGDTAATTALITGITGQDGSYLAEFLATCGYRIIGATRDVDHAATALPPSLKDRVELVKWDMRDQRGMREAIDRYRPSEVYNFAAYTSGAGMYDDPVGIGDINGLAVARLLEAVREVNAKTRFCQASSREIFGEAIESPQSETTRVNPRSPYGAAKLYADAMIAIFRKHYGLFACSAILFNHESPRRGMEFVTRKIACQAARIKFGLERELLLGNLETRRDWGFAGDHVRAMWHMLQQGEPRDYVVATGELHSVREFCEYAFGHVGLDYREFVREDSGSYRPSEPAPLVGDTTRARSMLGWKPEVGFRDLVAMMVDAELEALSGELGTKQ